ncbi:MAG: hypothetical protein GY810_00990 [Aureispira sp.]|nr:hypothetical protein [Aureispira sp.]
MKKRKGHFLEEYNQCSSNGRAISMRRDVFWFNPRRCFPKWKCKAKVPLRYLDKNGLIPYQKWNKVSEKFARPIRFNGKSHGEGSPSLQLKD